MVGEGTVASDRSVEDRACSMATTDPTATISLTSDVGEDND